MPASEIFPRLWIGGIQELDEFTKFVAGRMPIVSVCVRDDGCAHPDCLQMPVIVTPTVPPEEPINASMENLEKIAGYIDKFWNQKTLMFVHCTQGVERSPLAVAYWLVTRRGFSWDAAYQMILAKRPQAFNRSDWIPWSLRYGKPSAAYLNAV
jgi:hypothetical protein